MATAAMSNPPHLTIDANVLIALCSKEVDKYAIAYKELTQYAQAGYQFYAPGVIIAESLFVLCKKLEDKSLSPASHAAAVADLCAYMGMILPPPNGDSSLIARAEQIRQGYGCSRSADGLYIALTEELATKGVTEILTFDGGMENQAKANAPTVKVRVLVPSPPPASPPSNIAPSTAAPSTPP
jgi:predicted nucleic acid-binding protein